MYGWHPEGIRALKKTHQTPLHPNENKKNETAALTPTLRGRWAERKKENTEKPCKHQTCRLLQLFFASPRTDILLTAMQHKGIMLIVFLEYLISGHGEAGKQNKSILPFWNNLS